MSAAPAVLIQITDCHLMAEPHARLRGVDTEAAVAAVVAEAARARPDAVLVSGDLTQDGSAAAYRRLSALLATIGAPIHCLPGNHDLPAVMTRALPREGVALGRSFTVGGWDVIMLDTTVAGEDDGALSADELAALDRTLAVSPETPAMVALHHHPVAVGGAWGDSLGLAAAEPLFAVLDRHSRARALTWGHIHQAFDGARGDLGLYGTPASSFQFTRDADGDLAVADAPPGFRRFLLHGDGRVETAVAWLGRD